MPFSRSHTLDTAIRTRRHLSSNWLNTATSLLHIVSCQWFIISIWNYSITEPFFSHSLPSTAQLLKPVSHFVCACAVHAPSRIFHCRISAICWAFLLAPRRSSLLWLNINVQTSGAFVCGGIWRNQFCQWNEIFILFLSSGAAFFFCLNAASRWDISRSLKV